MSVSLSIRWPDGRHALFPFAGQRTAEAIASLAQELELELAPYLYSFFSVDHGNLDQMVKELRVLHAAVVRKWPGSHSLHENISRVIEELAKLRGTKGWDAAFG